MGKMIAVKVFIEPVVTAASGALPSGAAINASLKPITACDERATTTGHANTSRALKP